MQFINIPTMLVAFSTGMLTPVSGSSLSTDPTAGILAPAEWVIPNINGANVTFYGTATEVSAQLQALHAAWMPLNTTNIPNKIVETAGTRLCCLAAGWDWATNTDKEIFAFVDNLKAIGGDVIVQVNPYTQLDCLEGAGAWLCKDNPTTAWDIPIDDLATMVYNIAQDCSNYVDGNCTACGQQFDTIGWNIIAHTC